MNLQRAPIELPEQDPSAEVLEALKEAVATLEQGWSAWLKPEDYAWIIKSYRDIIARAEGRKK